MAYTTVDKCTANFNTKLYTGNGGTQSVTGVGFQPDWVWIKSRTDVSNHNVYDVVRGVSGGKLKPNNSDFQSYNAQDLTAFNTDGFTVGSNNEVNGNGKSLASWNWKAGNSAGSTNNDGNITSTVSVNTASGFSIVKYTGTGYAQTVGHGLGVAPKLIIIKDYNATTNSKWQLGTSELGWTKRQELNETNVISTTSGIWNDTAPTSSVFSIGTSGAVSESGGQFIAYCFAETTGFSQMGWYRGSGQDQGTFVTCSFKPKIVFIKNTEQGTDDWHIFDDQRSISGGGNPIKYRLFPNNNSAETTTDNMGFDFYSNGFQVTDNLGAINNFNEVIFYMAFGQTLTGSNDHPCTAR